MSGRGLGLEPKTNPFPPAEVPAPISEIELLNLLELHQWDEVDIELACRRLLMERVAR